MAIRKLLSIITLNANGQNDPIRSHKMVEWEKNVPYICCLDNTYFKPKDTQRMKLKGNEKIYHMNRNEKKAGVKILLLDKIVFTIETITKDQ